MLQVNWLTVFSRSLCDVVEVHRLGLGVILSGQVK